MKLSKNPTREEIAALAALPYGASRQVLIDNEKWDWSQDPEYSEYEVEVVGEVTVEVYSSTRVWAKSKDDARRQVQEMKTTSFDWVDDGYSNWDVEGSWDTGDITVVS